MDEQQRNAYLKGAVEALFFISDKPVEIDQIKEALQTFEASEIRQVVRVLQTEYEEQGRGMILTEIAGGFQLLSNPQYAEYVRNFFKTRVKEKLSRPALEALAIVAYRQPVSRADIELIRGVNSDGVVTHLLEKSLIKIVGRKDVPGRPFIYGTTKLFLEYFGLKSLKDLPKLEDVSELLQRDNDQREASGAGLFDSNKMLSVEDAVSDFGGDNHIQQSFAPDQNGDDIFVEADADGADGHDDAQNEDSAEEEPEELKKIMEEMRREQCPEQNPERDGQDAVAITETSSEHREE